MTTDEIPAEIPAIDVNWATLNLPDGLTVSEDGKLLNWRGTNYIAQATIPEDMTDRELLIELVTTARAVIADMAEFTSKIAGNSILSKIFGVKG